ncbi:hypothetical protein ACWFRC_26735, partial [Bacillus cereus]
VRFDEGKLKQKRDGKAIPKENLICFSFLLYEVDEQKNLKVVGPFFANFYYDKRRKVVFY